jgi:hypothetical protein
MRGSPASWDGEGDSVAEALQECRRGPGAPIRWATRAQPNDRRHEAGRHGRRTGRWRCAEQDREGSDGHEAETGHHRCLVGMPRLEQGSCVVAHEHEQDRKASDRAGERGANASKK